MAPITKTDKNKYDQELINRNVPVYYGLMDFRTSLIVFENESIIEKINWCDQLNGIHIERINTVFKYNDNTRVYEDTSCKYVNGVLMMIPPEASINGYRLVFKFL